MVSHMIQSNTSSRALPVMTKQVRAKRNLTKVVLLVTVAVCSLQGLTALFDLGIAQVPPPAAADLPPPPAAPGFATKIAAAAAQGATAAAVAALLSACSEPLVNRLLVKRQTFEQAWKELKFEDIATFFVTTFSTNMLKFPVFEVINMSLSFTTLAGSVRGVVNGFLFCTLMLPVTNYRFRKSMNWEVKFGDLYQAYLPTVGRDIVYGWARGLLQGQLLVAFQPETFVAKSAVFGLTIFLACIISSPCNEWRGFTLQRPDKRLPFVEFFKPMSYARSTGIGATIMGIALMVGMLITPLAEQVVSFLKSHLLLTVIVLFFVIFSLLAHTWIWGGRNRARPK